VCVDVLAIEINVAVHDFLLFNRDPERILPSFGRTNLNRPSWRIAAASGEA
jgi:hypothetical protein